MFVLIYMWLFVLHKIAVCRPKIFVRHANIILGAKTGAYGFLFMLYIHINRHTNFHATIDIIGVVF